MKIGILQPYLFPYLGYFQLISEVDHLVIHDDCQFIKGGWINRNRFLINGQPQLFSFPVEKASHAVPICGRSYVSSHAETLKKFKASIQNSYRKAPACNDVLGLIDEVAGERDLKVAAFNVQSIKKICAYLKIKTPISLSSALKLGDIAGSERVIEICKRHGASCYINPQGGVELYDPRNFADHGLELKFLKGQLKPYNQGLMEFFPGLSIVDVLMFNSHEACQSLLADYTT